LNHQKQTQVEIAYKQLAQLSVQVETRRR